MKKIKMVSGYAFEAPKQGPNSDEWEIEEYKPTGKERFIGFRTIDGALCAVFSCGDRKNRAQTTVSLGINGLK